MKTEESFKKSVKVTPKGCWEWQGSRNRKGYGATRYLGRSMGAHRVILLIRGVQLLPGIFVCHHCDNPSCCNPEHLFLGTHWDNIDDKMKKRGKGPCERKIHRVATEEQKAEIMIRGQRALQRALERGWNPGMEGKVS